jgi:hypothetical protein
VLRLFVIVVVTVVADEHFSVAQQFEHKRDHICNYPVTLKYIGCNGAIEQYVTEHKLIS